MSVRWKPMILLTAVFVVLAAMGLLAITSVLFPGRAEDVLPLARADAKAKKFDNAVIHYRRALQRDSKNATILMELADVFEAWGAHQPAMRPKLRVEWLGTLQSAAKHGKQMPEPRRRLLAEALAAGEWGDCLHWARELEALEPDNTDAHYVLASDALDQQPADLSQARAHLRVLESREPTRTRALWIKARAAQLSGEFTKVDSILDATRSEAVHGGAEDHLDGARLRLLDIERSNDPDALSSRLDALQRGIKPLADTSPSPARARELMRVLERAHRHLNSVATLRPKDRARLLELADALNPLAETTFQQAVKGSQGADLRPYQAYAEFLLFRGQRGRCMEVVTEGLRQPLANAALWITTSMELREIGIKAALSESSDNERFEKAGPWIRELLAAPNARHQALGHLFQGVIDLEQSGLAESMARDEGGAPAPKCDEQASASALAHLKGAADVLQDVPTARALYGIALMLRGESALGRQYLQQAQRLGGSRLDSRYQMWAALAILQAGYPEDAQPIIDGLIAEVAAGRTALEMKPTLHMIKAEILQARESGDNLREALKEYQRALDAGQPRTAAIELRLAHIGAMLGEVPSALQTIDKISSDDQAGPSAERIAILTLRQSGQNEQAERRLEQARKRYPDSPELVEMAAELRVASARAAEAERLLADFVAKHPGRVDLVLRRARILSESLSRADEAKVLLEHLCETSQMSAPFIQLAHLELARKNYEAAAKSIQQVRDRWPDAAAGDLLDAQLALSRGQSLIATEHLDAALRKDPNNKVALFWKGRLDALNGSPAQAKAIFEQLIRERPVKELDQGLSLGTAARWALASMALERQQFAAAAAGFESLAREDASLEVARPARWNLALAHAAQGQVNAAKAEVESLLSDPKTSHDERVQAADFFRRHGDEAAADRQIRIVLDAQPTHAGAVTFRALRLLSKEQTREAAEFVRGAIKPGGAPAGLYLLLAALENMAGKDGLPRARAVLEQGLQAFPDNAELLRARYQIMTLANDPRAIGVLEDTAKSNPNGPARQVLIEAHRDRKQFDRAAEEVAGQLKTVAQGSPQAKQLTAQWISLLIAEATHAGQAGDLRRQKAAIDKASELLLGARRGDPNDMRFLELEAELALQSGDLTRAGRLADELSDKDKGAPNGPLLRARVATAANQPEQAARAYEQAVERNPIRADLRLALASAQITSGHYDDAVRQTSAVLETERDMPAAQVLKAQALAFQKGAPARVAANREQAIMLLQSAIKSAPTYADAYHLLSDLLVLNNHRQQAIDLLKTCLERVPNDEAAFSLLIQRLSEPISPGKPADSVAVEEAQVLVQSRAAKDESGVFALAAAIGLHRAGRSDLALPWILKAVERIDKPAVHLSAGDILLSSAEQASDPAEARRWFEQSVSQYDRVLLSRPDSIEAINNKAWILHRHLGKNAEALELVEGLARRVDPNVLPPDFHDTLGAIREARGNLNDAQAAYAHGLRLAPEHPILNFHMGRLLAQQPDTAGRARQYLDKARRAREQLAPDMAAELDRLGTAAR